MIYYVLYELFYGHFKDKDWYLVKALNVFQYVTFRTAYASVTALLISLLFGRKFINALKRWNIGQQIREEGPQAHIAKRETPTMGGSFLVAALITSERAKAWSNSGPRVFSQAISSATVDTSRGSSMSSAATPVFSLTQAK